VCDEAFCAGCFASIHKKMPEPHTVMLLKNLSEYHPDKLVGMIIKKRKVEKEKKPKLILNEITSSDEVKRWKKF
jgi:hypothetical protein